MYRLVALQYSSRWCEGIDRRDFSSCSSPAERVYALEQGWSGNARSIERTSGFLGAGYLVDWWAWWEWMQGEDAEGDGSGVQLSEKHCKELPHQRQQQ